MDHEGLLTDLPDKAVDSIFTEFMTRCAELEEIVDTSQKFLRGVYQELEMLRRDPLSKAKVSSMVDDVIKSNYTDKMKEFVEAGFSNHDNVSQNISKLHFCKLGLEDYLMKAKSLLVELASLRDDATGNITQQSRSVQEEESLLPDEPLSRTTLMTIIYHMLELEFTMQGKIVRSVNLKTSSSELESYCLFWELRPYIDDNVMRQAWKYVSRQKKLKQVV